MKITQAVEHHLQYHKINSKKIPLKLASSFCITFLKHLLAGS